jgi:hypothetical protein
MWPKFEHWRYGKCRRSEQPKSPVMYLNKERMDALKMI